MGGMLLGRRPARVPHGALDELLIPGAHEPPPTRARFRRKLAPKYLLERGLRCSPHGGGCEVPSNDCPVFLAPNPLHNGAVAGFWILVRGELEFRGQPDGRFASLLKAHLK